MTQGHKSNNNWMVDAKRKKIVLEVLEETLYARPCQRLYQRQDALIEQNSRLHGNGQEWMRYRGQRLTHSKLRVRELPINPVHPDLRESVAEYLHDVESLEQQEMHYVRGYIRLVLNKSRQHWDLLALLPESLHRPIDKTIGIFGTGPSNDGLEAEEIEEILETNAPYIQMMKERMTINLIQS